jgi:hypothetical protein
MWNYIRRKLRLYEVQEDVVSLEHQISYLRNDVKAYAKVVAVQNAALGRIIAKLDPMYGKDELDPARKAASDELGQQVINKLAAERAAQNKLRGDEE